MTLGFYTDFQELFKGCVAYWDMSYSGTTCYDILGYSNGTISKASRNAADRFGIANRAFTVGSNNTTYIDTNVVPAWTEGTIVMWFKNSAAYNSTTRYHGCQTGTNAYPTCAFMRGTGWSAYFGAWIRSSDATSVGVSFSTTEVLTGNWQMVAMSWGSVVKCHVVSSGISASSAPTTVYPLGLQLSFCLGIMDTTPDIEWPSVIGETWMFNRQLTDVELNTLYNTSKSKYIYPVISPRGVE